MEDTKDKATNCVQLTQHEATSLVARLVVTFLTTYDTYLSIILIDTFEDSRLSQEQSGPHYAYANADASHGLGMAEVTTCRVQTTERSYVDDVEEDFGQRLVFVLTVTKAIVGRLHTITTHVTGHG